MGMEIFPPSGGGTDWSKYQGLAATYSNLITTASGEVTILNVTGKGFLKWLYGYFPSVASGGSSTDIVTLKIYVDGAVQFTYTFTQTALNNSKSCSLFCRDVLKIAFNSSTKNYEYPSGASYNDLQSVPTLVPSLPFTSSSTQFLYALLESPLAFSNSLKVTMQLSYTTQPTNNCNLNAGYLLGS